MSKANRKNVLIALSVLMLACGDSGGPSSPGFNEGDEPTPGFSEGDAPPSPQSVLEACGGSDFAGDAIFTGPVETSVFQCIIRGGGSPAEAQELYGKMLVNAISTTNLDAVRLLMGTNMDVDTTDLFGETTFLDHALGQVIMVSAGLDAGYETDASKYDRAVEIALLLVGRGARIDEDENDDYLVLWFASLDRSIEATEIMIDAGMDVNTRRPLDERWNPETALVPVVKGACWSNDEASRAYAAGVARVLIEAGADVNTMTFGQILEQASGAGFVVVGLYEAKTVLQLALENGTCPEVVKMLRDAGACEELEGRRFEWGRTVTGWDGILRFLQEVAEVYEPRDVDCST